MGLLRVFVSSWLFLAAAIPGSAQSLAATRLNILQAEDRRAPTANDVAILRAGARSGDPLTARMGLRALGRLERPSLIPDITPGLRHPAPENRVEAATAIGQAAQGWKREPAKGAPAAVSLDSLVTTLVARLKVDDDADVRAAICETLGRLPYTSATQAANAERALLDMAARAESVTDRLGVAKGFEAFVRLHRALRPPSDEAITVLRRLAAPANGDLATGARIRRLAFESLVLAGSPDADLLEAASHDPDPQVRRLAMRVVATRGRPAGPNGYGGPSAAILPTEASWATWLKDDSPIVRLEALRALRARGAEEACPASILGALDRDPHVALLAIDQLSACGASPVAVALLEYNVEDRVTMNAPRGWHRAAHALVALAGASPERAAAPLQQIAGAQPWQMRMYAARAAAVLKDRAMLERLAKDESDNVCEAAIGGLKTVAGHDADDVYRAALTRTGYQAVRAAAAALDGSPRADEASAALKAAQTRLMAEGRDNSHDKRRQSKQDPAERSQRRRDAPSRGAARADHDSRRWYLRAGALHRTSAGDGSPLRAPGGSGLLQRPDLSSRRAELRDPGRQPRRQRICRRCRVHARRARVVAARARRGWHFDARARHRRRPDLHRPRGQSTPRSRLHRLRAGAERDRRRRSHSRRRCDRTN
jgi:hypothetical protein